MLFSKQSLIAVYLSLLGISSTTTAIRNENNFLADHQKDEAASVITHSSPLRTNRKLRKSGKSGKINIPPPSQCYDYDIDSILIVIANADILTLSNDIVQQNALETFIIDEYNELASQECGEGVRFLTSAEISFGADALAINPMIRALHQSSSENNHHHGRRLESSRPEPKLALSHNTKGYCNKCRKDNALKKDTSNRFLSFLEELKTASAASNLHASSSDHQRQRQAKKVKKGGDGGKRDIEPSAQITFDTLGKKNSSKSPSGKKGEDSLKGKKSSSSTSGKVSMKDEKGDSTATAPGGNAPGTAKSDKASMDKTSRDFPSESSTSPATAASSGKGGKSGEIAPTPEPEECCEPPTDIELSAALSGALQEDPSAVPSISNVDSIVELSPVDCSDEVITLHGVVSIEHEASQLKTHELELLEEAFIDAYNQANSLNIDICDPSFRAVTECTVHVPSSVGRYLNSVPVTSASTVLEYHYTATCRGCKEGSKIFESTAAGRNLEMYDEDSSSQGIALVFAGDYRHLAEIIEAKCFCPSVALSESRGPTTGEFFDIFADLFDFLRVEDKILHIETVGTISEH